MKKILFWNSKYRVKRSDGTLGFGLRSEPGHLDISNWNVVKLESLNIWNYQAVEGIFIRADSRGTWFLPVISLTTFFDFIHSNKTKLEQFYIRAATHHAAECFQCKGSGKIDWVSRLTQVRRRKFIRSQDIISQYVIPKKALEKQDLIYPEIYISKAKLERGESWCHECRGTGVQLDGRLTIFRGFREMKKRVKDFDSKEVHKRVLNLTKEKEV